MARTFKIIVPKPASSNAKGTEVKLYKANEIINSQGTWQDEVMETFIKNGWAMEVKVDSVEETLDVNAGLGVNVNPKPLTDVRNPLVDNSLLELRRCRLISLF